MNFLKFCFLLLLSFQAMATDGRHGNAVDTIQQINVTNPDLLNNTEERQDQRDILENTAEREAMLDAMKLNCVLPATKIAGVCVCPTTGQWQPDGAGGCRCGINGSANATCNGCLNGDTLVGSTCTKTCDPVEEILESGVCKCKNAANYYGSAGACQLCTGTVTNNTCEIGCDATKEKRVHGICICNAALRYYGTAGDCDLCPTTSTLASDTCTSPCLATEGKVMIGTTCTDCWSQDKVVGIGACNACVAPKPNFNRTTHLCEAAATCLATEGKVMIGTTCSDCWSQYKTVGTGACDPCPASAPRFDTSTHTCNACPTSNPTYNASTNTCGGGGGACDASLGLGGTSAPCFNCWEDDNGYVDSNGACASCPGIQKRVAGTNTCDGAALVCDKDEGKILGDPTHTACTDCWGTYNLTRIVNAEGTACELCPDGELRVAGTNTCAPTVSCDADAGLINDGNGTCICQTALGWAGNATDGCTNCWSSGKIANHDGSACQACLSTMVLASGSNNCIDRTCTTPQVLNADKTACVDPQQSVCLLSGPGVTGTGASCTCDTDVGYCQSGNTCYFRCDSGEMFQLEQCITPYNSSTGTSTSREAPDCN